MMDMNLGSQQPVGQGPDGCLASWPSVEQQAEVHIRSTFHVTHALYTTTFAQEPLARNARIEPDLPLESLMA